METVYLLLTRRRVVWRVRILSGGVIRWRTYRIADYPTPEAVVRRCAAGLLSTRQAIREDEKPYRYDPSDDDTRPTRKRDQSGISPHSSPLRVRWEFQPRLWE